MSASYVHKTVFGTKSEFVEDSAIDELGRFPERTTPGLKVKVAHSVKTFSSYTSCESVYSSLDRGARIGALNMGRALKQLECL